MTRRPSVLLALPAISALAMFAWFAHDPLVTPLCAIAIALSYTHRFSMADVDTRKGMARTVAVAALILVYYIVLIAPGIGHRSAHRELVGGEHVLAAAGLAAAVALARLWHLVDARDRKVGLALALIGLLAVLSGNTYEWRLPYVVGLLLFCLTAVLALLENGGALRPRQRSFRASLARTAVVLTYLTLIAGLAVGAVFALRAAEHAIIGWRPAQLIDRAPIGFGSGMRIQRHMKLSLSDAIVATLDGVSPPGYLRMEVFSKYGDGRWSIVDSNLTAAPTSPVLLTTNLRGPDPTPTGMHIVEPQLELSTALMLPYSITSLWLPETAIGCTLSTDGIARCEGLKGNYRWDAAIGQVPEQTTTTSLDPEMLAIPPAVATAIAPMTHSIIGEPITQLNVLAAAGQVAQHLRSKHQYSLDVDLAKRGDPVVDFILHQRPGWCEHFASAMVLMMRSVGVPARVVGGFVAEEYSQLARRWIVRLDDAHAWCEIYDYQTNTWVAFDPTPTTAATLREQQSLLAQLKSLVDVVGLLLQQLRTAWGQLDLVGLGQQLLDGLWSARQPLAAVVSLLAMLGLGRVGRVVAGLRRRFARIGHRPNPLHPAAKCFARLQGEAARVALPISKHETITGYVERMRVHPVGHQVADDLDRFAKTYLAARFSLSPLDVTPDLRTLLEQTTLATLVRLKRVRQQRPTN